jgi:hypothetical protein
MQAKPSKRVTPPILPHSFAKIRHCGLYAPCRVRTRLQGARFLASLPSDPFAILAMVFAGARDKATAVATMSRALDPHYVPHEPASVVHSAAIDWQQRLFNLSGNDSSRCPRCAHPLTHRQFAPFTPPSIGTGPLSSLHAIAHGMSHDPPLRSFGDLRPSSAYQADFAHCQRLPSLAGLHQSAADRQQMSRRPLLRPLPDQDTPPLSLLANVVPRLRPTRRCAGPEHAR